MKLCTQLNFGGNCKEAFRFYEQHLGGRITSLVEQRQMPNFTRRFFATSKKPTADHYSPTLL